MRKRYSHLVLFLVFLLSLLLGSTESYSYTNGKECRSKCKKCVACCTVGSAYDVTEDQFDAYRKNFIMNSFYFNTVDKTFRKWVDELRNAEMFKTVAYGTFFDASILTDTLRDLQVSSAKTLQNYMPSEQICRFGTLTRSLAASESKVDTDRLVLGEAGLSRSLGTMSSVAAAGRGLDNEYRLRLFAETFCDLSDNASGLSGLCVVATPAADYAQNRDIDFSRMLDDKPTINADFTDANLTQDENNAMALSRYLYGHRQPSRRISDAELRESSGSAGLYREYRSVYARRAAAQNSYNTMVAMKSAGSGATDTYMRAVLQQLGLSSQDVDRYLGGMSGKDAVKNSSYYAQMEVLAKKLYQDPAFFANLMDSKSNVRRASTAMQGIGLMQDRDIYKSMERSEMLLGLLVQLEGRKMVANNQRQKD